MEMTRSLIGPYFLHFFLPLLFCLVGFFNAQGQEATFWQLSDEEGLPSMTVYEILQDDLGYIWMGTENGIYRYDGQSFKSFSDPLLKDNTILKVRKDKWNRIWFINLSKQLAYIEEERVILFPQDSILSSAKISNLCVGENVLWLFSETTSGHEHSILNYQLYSEKQPVFNTRFDHDCAPVNPMESLGDQLSILKLNTDSLRVLKHLTANKSIIKTETSQHFFKRSTSHSIFSHFQGYTLMAIKNRTQDLKIIAVSNDQIIELASFKTAIKVNNLKVIDNTCWIVANNGLWSFPLSSPLKTSIPTQVLHDVNANDIIKDREGNYWVSTTSQGLKIYPSLDTKTLNTKEGNLPNNEVYCLYYDAQKNQIISGHNDGKIAIHHLHKKSKIIDLKLKGRVLDISKVPQNSFSIIVDDGIISLDKNFNPYSLQTNVNLSGRKTALADQKGRIWHGSSTRAEYYSNEKKVSQSVVILDKRTYAIVQDVHQKIWLGTIEGLYCFQDSLYPFLTNNIHEKYYVTSIAQAPDSTLWVSTKSDGILAIKNDCILHRYTLKDGLASNQCKKVFSDSTHLWIATNKGLNYLHYETGIMGWINKTDGLPSSEIYDVLVAKNEVWAATPKGIVHFPTNLKHLNETPPPIAITSLKIWEKEYPLDSIIHLKHHQNSLQLSFVGLGFKAKNAITYKYKMQGLDQDWIYTNTPSIRYPAVNPGDYRLAVYAINEDGIQSLQPATLRVSIAEAWWQQWWLQLIILLLLLVAVFFFSQNHFLKQEEHRKTQDKIKQLKQEALQAQMNPHFIFNVLSAIQNSLTVNKQEQAMLYLSSFSKLIRSIFDYSKRREITLEEEIDFLKHYLNLEKLRFKNKIKVDFIIEPELEEYLYFTKIPPLLLQPLVENAFKHGLFHKEENGYLLLRFSKEKTCLQFTIEDNGIGREKSKTINSKKQQYQSHHSSGLQTIEERLKIINQKNLPSDFPAFQIEDLYHQQEAIGTRIIVSIYHQNFN